jgi:hypothetical protein
MKIKRLNTHIVLEKIVMKLGPLELPPLASAPARG